MDMAEKVSVLDDVRAIVGATIRLGVERIDSDAEFADLGIDSIIVMEMLERLSRHFGIALTPAQFLDVNSVREMAVYIESNFKTAPAPVASPAAAAPPVAKASPAQPSGALLDAVRQRYGIDLAGRQWDSVDQIVDEILLRHPGEALSVLDAGALLGDANMSPAGALRTTDVAIVGISCRFPDAPDATAFWNNLIARKSSIREIAPARWDWRSCYAADAAPGKTVSRWAAMIDDVDCFDADFFAIDAQEARLIDPQERLLMQEVYRAMQDAGTSASQLAGSNTGVFIGYEYAEYEQYLRSNIAQVPGLVCSSASPSYYLANRLSYVFDLRGPSESVNLNCASSAVAINRACLSLAGGESEIAIAGAACLHLFPGDYITSSQYGLLSPDGTCGVFDNEANGFTRGEGVGVLVLKRLERAEADGDRIYGVIKACQQSNRGGASSLSEVKHEAITDVIQRCYQKAGIAPTSVSYMELNGYAKKWADSFEFEGVRKVFEDGAGAKTCALGSLKGNIGHLEPVNGIASVIKVALSLHHKCFPATITRNVASSFIDLASERHPLYFASSEIDFDAIRASAATPVRAAVSAFADSGVNVHIALEEYLPARPAAPATDALEHLFVLSAKSQDRLYAYVDAFIAFLAHEGAVDNFVDLIYTQQAGRDAMPVRLAVSANSAAQLRDKLVLFRTGPGRTRLEAQGIHHCDARRAEADPLSGLITADMTRTQLVLSGQSRNWQAVAQLWVRGVEMPWTLLWTGQAVRKVSLPGYPFARQRHWVDLEVPAAGVAGEVLAATGQPAEPQPASLQPAAAYGQAEWRFFRAIAGGEDASAMAPVAKLELFLRQEVAMLRRCSVEEIDVQANLVALGLSSSGIAELITRTAQLMQISVAPSVVFKHPQIHALAGHLAARYPDKVAALAVSRHGALARAWNDDAAVGADAGAASAILVPMQPQGAGVPLFIVPGADGSALSLKLLCEALGSRQPLYALEASGLDGCAALPASVQEIAQLNIAALRTVAPHGPYQLLGYSNGGVVAFDMARALMEQGEQVASLTLVDSLCPPQRSASAIDLVVQVFAHLVASLGGQLEIDAAALAHLDENARATYLYDALTSCGIALERDYFFATYRVATHSETLCRAYTPVPLPEAVDATLLRASDGYPGAPDDYGWNRYLRRPLRVHTVPANHFTLIEAGAVGVLAGHIRAPRGGGAVQQPSGTPGGRNAKNARQAGRPGKRRGPSVAEL